MQLFSKIECGNEKVSRFSPKNRLHIFESKGSTLVFIPNVDPFLFDF